MQPLFVAPEGLRCSPSLFDVVSPSCGTDGPSSVCHVDNGHAARIHVDMCVT